MNTTNNNSVTHLLWGVGGLIAGSYLARQSINEAKKSRAEIDYPDETEDAYTEVTELLQEWIPAEECEDEYDFVEDLAFYLQGNSDLDVEICPHTPEGQPDIVIEDLIALELKLGLSKKERDRAIGQCAGYSRQWLTLLVVIGAPLTKTKRLIELLEDKDLQQIEVWTVEVDIEEELDD